MFLPNLYISLFNCNAQYFIHNFVSHHGLVAVPGFLLFHIVVDNSYSQVCHIPVFTDRTNNHRDHTSWSFSLYLRIANTHRMISYLAALKKTRCGNMIEQVLVKVFIRFDNWNDETDEQLTSVQNVYAVETDARLLGVTKNGLDCVATYSLSRATFVNKWFMAAFIDINGLIANLSAWLTTIDCKCEWYGSSITW